jgi:hypothetical protein
VLRYSAPPGYVRTRLPVRLKLDPFIGIIDRILDEDKERPKKLRQTSKRRKRPVNPPNFNRSVSATFSA